MSGLIMSDQIREDVTAQRWAFFTDRSQPVHWTELNKNCKDVFAPMFYELYSTEALDADNETELFCLPSQDQSQTESWKQHLTVIHKPQGNKQLEFWWGGGHIRQDLQSLCCPA